jgi:hypothetical protein
LPHKFIGICCYTLNINVTVHFNIYSNVSSIQDLFQFFNYTRIRMTIHTCIYHNYIHLKWTNLYSCTWNTICTEMWFVLNLCEVSVFTFCAMESWWPWTFDLINDRGYNLNAESCKWIYHVNHWPSFLDHQIFWRPILLQIWKDAKLVQINFRNTFQYGGTIFKALFEFIFKLKRIIILKLPPLNVCHPWQKFNLLHNRLVIFDFRLVSSHFKVDTYHLFIFLNNITKNETI